MGFFPKHSIDISQLHVPYIFDVYRHQRRVSGQSYYERTCTIFLVFKLGH